MIDFSDLKYKAPDPEAVADELRKIRLRMRMSLSEEGVIKGLQDLDALLRDLEEMYLICQVNYSKETDNAYWQHQYESFYSWAPMLKISLQETLAVLTDHRDEIEITAVTGSRTFSQAASLLATYSSDIKKELQELVQCRLRYRRLISQLGLISQGFLQPNYQLKKSLTHPDQDRRCLVYKRWVLSFNSKRNEMLELYLRILSLLRSISEKMGYSRISDYLERVPECDCLKTAEQESSLAHSIRRYFLPIQYELKRQQSLRLGRESLPPWDQWMPTLAGYPAPRPEENNIDTLKTCLKALFDDEASFLLDALNFSGSTVRADIYEAMDRVSFHLPASDLPFMAYNFTPEGFHIFDIFNEIGGLCADTAAFRNRTNLFSWSPDREIREVCSVSVETLSSSYCKMFYGDSAEAAFDIRITECLQKMMEAAAITLFEQEAMSLSEPDGRKLAEIWTSEELRSGLAGSPWDDSANFLAGYGFLLHPSLFLQPLQHLTRARANIRVWLFKPFSGKGARKLGGALSQLLAGDTATGDQLTRAGFSDPITDLDLKLAAFNICDRLQL